VMRGAQRMGALGARVRLLPCPRWTSLSAAGTRGLPRSRAHVLGWGGTTLNQI